MFVLELWEKYHVRPKKEREQKAREQKRVARSLQTRSLTVELIRKYELTKEEAEMLCFLQTAWIMISKEQVEGILSQIKGDAPRVAEAFQELLKVDPKKW